MYTDEWMGYINYLVKVSCCSCVLTAIFFFEFETSFFVEQIGYRMV